MRLPRSTDLPQRATSSPFTSLLYILACTARFTSHAFAAKDASIAHENHNHALLNSALEVGVGHDLKNYEPEFAGADRSIIGRAGDGNPTLSNNVPGTKNITQGEPHYWTFPKKNLFGAKSPQTPGLLSYLEGQDVSVTPDDPSEIELYISLTTCRQPLAKDPNSDGPPEQLKLFISTSSNKQQPDETDIAVPIEDGFGWLNISVKNDVYFGVYAPANEGYDGVYNYQLTASIDRFFASAYNDTNSDPPIYFIDSDSESALLYSRNTTNTTSSSDPVVFQQWMDRSPPFSLFVQNSNDPSILGLQKSVCGLQNLAQIQFPQDVEPAMIAAAGDGLPRQQFYVKNLNRSSTYQAIIAMIDNSTNNGSGVVGGGGTVWANPQNFTTKLLDNCALLFNLPFCTSVAYAAPANPQTFNTTALGQQYDEYAKNLYQNFSYSLQQIPCDTTASAQYSLARTCNDCDAAYRQWLCAVTIPRCEDFSNSSSYLQPRAVNDSNRFAFKNSRNPMIDTAIRPGPYKELLPCDDMCYNLTRSCPAALQFACPLEGHGLDLSYGNGTTCNRPWTGKNGAAALRATGLVAFSVALTVAFVTTAS